MYEELFTPIKINKLEIKNRLAMAPMFTAGLVDSGDLYSQRAIDYYEERAKGGTGLIITGINRVENEIEKLIFMIPYPTPMNMPNFRELTEAVHYHGAKLFLQLTAGLGRNAPVMPGVKPISASSVPAYFDPSVTCHELTIEEIETIIKSFGDAAEILAAVGVDGVEIHGHEGYLIDQFATSLWNRRGDKYGGSLVDRLRFATEILQVIKNRVGNDFVVTYRYGVKTYLKTFEKGAVPGEEFTELGRDLDESIQMARLLDEAGYDGLHIDAGGSYNSYWWAHPPMYMKHGVGLDAVIHKIKEAVNIPVMVCSRFDIPKLAEGVVKEGKADMVVLGRGLIADPYWPRKVWEGRVEDIRPCIGCDLGCQGRMNIGGTISCALNPQAGRERIWELRPVVRQKEVLVVGGGLAGMEAARVLTERGHKVSLWEKTKALGGHLIEASVPHFKKDLKRLLGWYETQLKKLEVETTMDTEVTPELIDEKKPDAIILATGSQHFIPEVPGIEKSNVHTAIDVFLGKESVKDKVVVVGGGLVGCEVALWLAQTGKKVTVIEKLQKLMPDEIDHNANREMLMGMLDHQEVEQRTNTALAAVTDEGVEVIEKDLQITSIGCDSVVIAVGFKPENSLAQTLEDKKYRVYKIGDCKDPRRILNAVWDAYKIANSI